MTYTIRAYENGKVIETRVCKTFGGFLRELEDMLLDYGYKSIGITLEKDEGVENGEEHSQDI